MIRMKFKEIMMPVSKKRLTELKAIRDEEIDTGDIPELDESFWANAGVVTTI